MIITECPRDAMQGLPYHITSSEKIRYLTSLLSVGFRQLDVGSFVSPNAIPQMRDTPFVIESLIPIKDRCRFSVIVANERGAREALSHPAVDIIGFPWSISPSFLKYNLNSNPTASWILLGKMQRLSDMVGKDFTVYISMAFGNPYGDPWSRNLLLEATEQLVQTGIRNIILSDTIGVGNPNDIEFIFNNMAKYTSIKIGAHLHSSPKRIKELIASAWDGGCRRFDSAIHGMGGCPLSGHELIGNVNTLGLIQYCEENGIGHELDLDKLMESQMLALQIFSR